PQTEILMVAAALFVAISCLNYRQWFLCGFFLPASILFLAYSLAFYIQGESIVKVARSYVDVANKIPVITAYIPNIWYTIAYFLAPESRHYYPDEFLLLGVVSYRNIGAALTLAALGIFTFNLA